MSLWSSCKHIQRGHRHRQTRLSHFIFKFKFKIHTDANDRDCHKNALSQAQNPQIQVHTHASVTLATKMDPLPPDRDALTNPTQNLAARWCHKPQYGLLPCFYFLCDGSVLVVLLFFVELSPTLFSVYPAPKLPAPSLHCACVLILFFSLSPPPPQYQSAVPGPGGGRDGATSRAPGPLRRCWLEPPPSLQPAAGME